ncbi:MAG TPA: glycosyltransferase [Tepidisphaeraceae bacterium]|nr:glycosyltransferase [Tepidisphaeraceae bacterium]
MRVLLVAEACNPEWVSVPLVGWSHARAIAKLTDAHLATQVRNRDAILRAGLIEGRDFTPINTEPLLGRIYQFAGLFGLGEGGRWTALGSMTSLAYPYFEHLIWRQFGRRIQAGEFDIVHRLIPLNQASPSPLAARCHAAGVPFVLGPLNGGLPWPHGYEDVRKREGEWPSSVREVYRLAPGYHSTRRHAAAIIAASRTAFKEIPRQYRGKCFYTPENSIDPNKFVARRTRRASSPLRVVFVGRLVPCKAVDLLLEAAAPLARERKLQLELIGDGPEMPRLRDLVKREQIESSVKFAGWVEHSKLQDRLIEHDLFAFPSIRDFGGGAVLEAMAVGLAPMVVAYGGPAELVTDRSGFLIPLGPPDEVVARMRAALTDLAAHPGRVDAAGEASYRRAHTLFTWDAKARQVVDIYRWILDRQRQKPRLSIPLPDVA